LSLGLLFFGVHGLEPTKSEDISHDDQKARKIAIVLLSFFFLTAARSSVQFGLGDYFKHTNSTNPFISASIAFLISNVIVNLIAIVTMKTKLKQHIKSIAVSLTFTSLI